MSWSLNDPLGLIARFNIHHRITTPARVTSHSNRLVVVTTGTKFANVFEVVTARLDDGVSDRRLRHVASIFCYDVIAAASLVCPVRTSGGENDEPSARVFVLTRSGDCLTTNLHPLHFRSSKKRKCEEEGDDDDDDGDGSTVTLKLSTEDRFHSCETDVVGFSAVDSGAGTVVVIVVEKNKYGGLVTTVFRRDIADGSWRDESFPLPGLVSAMIRTVDVSVIASNGSKERRNICHSCLKEVDAELYRRLVARNVRNRNSRGESVDVRTFDQSPAPASLLFLLAFDSGQVFAALYDAKSASTSPPVFLTDFHHSLRHLGVISGEDSDDVGGILLGVSPSGATTKLVLDSELNVTKLESASLPDSANCASSSSFHDLFFCSESFFYAVDPRRKRNDRTDAPYEVATSRLFSHANVAAFALIHDADLGRVPDLLFFIDARGDFHYRRLVARGSRASSAVRVDVDEGLRRPSGFSTSANELTARRARNEAANRALNDVVETLVVCGHLRTCLGETADGESAKTLLRVEFDVIGRDYGDARDVEAQLTLWNDSEAYVFDEGWRWSLVVADQDSSSKDTVAVQRSASLTNFRPGQFRRFSIPLQDLGLEISNALRTNLDVRVLVAFSYTTFVHSRRGSLRRWFPVLNENREDDHALAFPVYEKRVDFLDLMLVERKSDANESLSASSQSPSGRSSIRPRVDSDAGSFRVNNSTIAERLVDDVAESRPEMFAFEEPFQRGSEISAPVGPSNEDRRSTTFRTTIDLKRSTAVSSASATTEKASPRGFSAIFGAKLKNVDPTDGGRVLLREPFSGEECSLVFRRRGADDASSEIFLELISASPPLLFAIRQLIARRLAELSPGDGVETENDNSSLTDAVIETKMKELDEIEKKLRDWKRRLSTMEELRSVPDDVYEIVLRLLETDLAR